MITNSGVTSQLEDQVIIQVHHNTRMYYMEAAYFGNDCLFSIPDNKA
jgi:hypothetical protein